MNQPKQTGTSTARRALSAVAALAMALSAVVLLSRSSDAHPAGLPAPRPPASVSISTTGATNRTVVVPFTASPDSRFTHYYQYSLNEGDWVDIGVRNGQLDMRPEDWTIRLTDNPSLPGQRYSVRLRAVGLHAGSNGQLHPNYGQSTAAVVALTPPSINGLNGRDRALRLRWSGCYGANTISKYQYRIDSGTWRDMPQYSTDQGTNCTSHQTTIDDTSFSEIKNGESYRVAVRAVDKDSTASPASQTYLGMPINGIIQAPTNVTATPGDGRILVSWTAPPGVVDIYEVNIFGYWGERRVRGTSHVETGLVNGRTYTVTVRARNSVAVGAASAPITVTPNP